MQKKITCRIIFLSALLMISCDNVPKDVENVLEQAMDNHDELQKVIDHYQAPKDSLKLKAAYFLIGNMDTKYSYDHDKIGPHRTLLSFIDSIHKAQVPIVKSPAKFWTVDKEISAEGHTPVDARWDSIKKLHGPLSTSSLPILLDIKTIDADYLIENIEHAFMAWQRPWAKHLDFDQFCEYVLPYRNLNEPLETWRKEVFEKYAPYLDSLDRDAENIALKAAQQLYDRASVVKNNYFTFREYPDLGWKDLNTVRIGTCRDQSNYISYIMRSQGIPIGTVFLAHGTEWNVLIDSKGNYLQFAGYDYPPNENFNYYLDNWKSPSTTASKFFMHSFKKDMGLLNELPIDDIPPFFRNPNLKDVTRLLHDNPVSLEVALTDNVPKEHAYLFLCDYTGETKWSAIDWSKIDNGKAAFPSVGSKKIYLPSIFKNNTYTYIQDPIYLDDNGNQTDLRADLDSKETIRLYRKYARGIAESRFAKKMVGAYFQVANKPDFSDAVTVHTINNVPDRAEEAEMDLDKDYRYVRYVSDTIVNIAELGFFDKEGSMLKGKLIWSSKDPSYKPENAFDQDIRTNYDNYDPSSWIGLDLKKRVRIAKLKYLFRNSFNTIEPGHEYELFYWEGNGWNSLGRKTAQKDHLDYEAPKNALLLLKNHTEGNQEMIFFMKDGKQIWG